MKGSMVRVLALVVVAVLALTVDAVRIKPAGEQPAARSTAGQAWLDVQPADLEQCPTEDESFMAMLGRPCMWECYEFLHAKDIVFKRIVEGLHCNGGLSDSEIEELIDDLLTSTDSFCAAENVLGRDPNGMEEMYMCISSKAVMTIVNRLLQTCPNGDADYSNLPIPAIKTGVLHCESSGTLGDEVLGGYLADPEVMDGKEEEECDGQVPCDEVTKYLWLLDEQRKNTKRETYASARHSVVQERMNALETVLEAATTKGVYRTYLTLYTMYRWRNKENDDVRKAFTIKLRNIRRSLEDLEGLNPELSEIGARYVEETWTREREQQEQRAAQQAPPVALESEEERYSLTCVNENSSCGSHFWKSNIRVNDECFSVCVNSVCATDFTFFYCFLSTTSVGMTKPECHANVVTRQTCFSEYTDL